MVGINSAHERMRKEQSRHDTNLQCGKYDRECKYHGKVNLSPKEIEEYLKASDKTKYLKSIGKCFA